MSTNVNRLVRMRTTAIPFTDAFGRSDLEDTTHPWYAPVVPNGSRMGIGSGQLLNASADSSNVSLAYLRLDDAEFDLTFTFTRGSNTPGDMQCFFALYDPTEYPGVEPERFSWATSASTTTSIYHVVGNTFTPLVTVTSPAITAGSTHTVRIVLTASVLRYYLDGVQQYLGAPPFTVPASQTTIMFLTNDATGTFDDVSIATPPAPAGFLDTFTRADSTTTLGSDWIALAGTWGITSNRAYCVTTAAANHFAGHDMLTPNCDAQVDAVTGGNPFYQGLVFRWVDANNYCLVDRDNLYVVSGGVQTSYAHSSPFVDGVDATIRVVANGTSITVYKNATAINTRTLTTPQGDIWGIRTYTGGTSYRLDNFSATPI